MCTSFCITICFYQTCLTLKFSLDYPCNLRRSLAVVTVQFLLWYVFIGKRREGNPLPVYFPHYAVKFVGGKKDKFYFWKKEILLYCWEWNCSIESITTDLPKLVTYHLLVVVGRGWSACVLIKQVVLDSVSGDCQSFLLFCILWIQKSWERICEGLKYWFVCLSTADTRQWHVNHWKCHQ